MSKKVINLSGVLTTSQPNGGVVARSHVLSGADASFALQNGDNAQIIKLLNAGIHPDLMLSHDTNSSALSIAIANKHSGLVEILLAHGANPNSQKDPGYLTQILMALLDEINYWVNKKNDSPEIIETEIPYNIKNSIKIFAALLNYGADPNVVCFPLNQDTPGYLLHNICVNYNNNNKIAFNGIINALQKSKIKVNKSLKDQFGHQIDYYINSKEDELKVELEEFFKKI